jgi:hypothetical protein
MADKQLRRDGIGLKYGICICRGMRREVCANGSGITGAKLVFFMEDGLFYFPLRDTAPIQTKNYEGG